MRTNVLDFQIIKVSSKKKLRNNLCERSEQKILEKFALF